MMSKKMAELEDDFGEFKAHTERRFVSLDMGIRAYRLEEDQRHEERIRKFDELKSLLLSFIQKQASPVKPPPLKTIEVPIKTTQYAPANDDTGRLLLHNSVESSMTMEKKKNIEYLNVGSSTSKAGIEVKTYNDNSKKDKGEVIDVEYNNNNGDIHPLVESWGLQGGIDHNSSVDTKVEPSDSGKLVTRNDDGVFGAAGGSINITNSVTKGRTGLLLQEELEPKMDLEANLKIEPEFSLKASHSIIAEDCHYTNFRQHMDHSFVHVMIRLTRDPQGTKLQVKVWDPGITGGHILKKHLEDKVFLGAGVMIRSRLLLFL